MRQREGGKHNRTIYYEYKDLVRHVRVRVRVLVRVRVCACVQMAALPAKVEQILVSNEAKLQVT